MASKAREEDFSYDLNSIRRASRDKPLILLQEFYETSYPSKKQLEFLIRTEHSYSDVLVLPLVSRITDALDAGAGFERYLKFLRETMGLVETFNKVLNETYIHGINVSPGRPKRVSPVSPNHSILSFGFGADSFGDLHRPKVIVKEPQEERPVPQRLFYRGDYGDHLIKSKAGLATISPESTGFSLQECLGNRNLTRLYNAEQHSLEATTLPRYIEPGRGEPDVERYVSGKQYVERDTLKQMRSLNASVRLQRRL